MGFSEYRPILNSLLSSPSSGWFQGWQGSNTLADCAWVPEHWLCHASGQGRRRPWGKSSRSGRHWAHTARWLILSKAWMKRHVQEFNCWNCAWSASLPVFGSLVIRVLYPHPTQVNDKEGQSPSSFASPEVLKALHAAAAGQEDMEL